MPADGAEGAAEPVDEFDTIALFRRVAHPEWARGLADDVAVMPTRPGFDLVVTKDAIVEGVHFLPDDPFDTVARKLVRVNISDLAAKGAEPFGYLLACHWSETCGQAAREAFVEGLAVDQGRYGIKLLGGDTVSTPGPASFSMTLMGWAPKGRVPSRAGARPGDIVMVTGQIGDGVLGLKALRGGVGLKGDRLTTLITRYRVPEPPIEAAPLILAHATASLDVSDGLVADLGHISRASGVRIEIALERLPLSAAGAAWLGGRVDPMSALVELATGGDDYEIAFTVRPGSEDVVRREAERLLIPVTAIGRVTAGQGVGVTHEGSAVAIDKAGWRHR